MSNLEMSNQTTETQKLWGQLQIAWVKLPLSYQKYLVEWAQQLVKR